MTCPRTQGGLEAKCTWSQSPVAWGWEVLVLSPISLDAGSELCRRTLCQQNSAHVGQGDFRRWLWGSGPCWLLHASIFTLLLLCSKPLLLLDLEYTFLSSSNTIPSLQSLGPSKSYPRDKQRKYLLKKDFPWLPTSLDSLERNASPSTRQALL